MPLKIFTDQKRPIRIAAMATLLCSFALGLVQALLEGSLLNPKFYLGFKGLLWILTFLVLPPISAIGIDRQKTWGIKMTSYYIGLSVQALAFSLSVWGPSLVFPQAWWIVASCIVLLTLLRADLWRAQWADFDASRSFTPLWVDQGIMLVVCLLIISMPIAALVRQGGPYPKLETFPDTGQSQGESLDLPIPFQFQVDIPVDAKIVGVFPETSDVIFSVSGRTWMLGPSNYFQDAIQDLSMSQPRVRKFVAERYGMLPNVIKFMTFGLHPARFVEISSDGLWGAASIESRKDQSADVKIFLWVGTKGALGNLYVNLGSSQPKDWAWIHSIGKSTEPAWSADRYAEEAALSMAKGKTDRAGFCLTFAVIADQDKAKRLNPLILHLKRFGTPARAKSQLSRALKAYPNDPQLRAIKLP